MHVNRQIVINWNDILNTVSKKDRDIILDTLDSESTLHLTMETMIKGRWVEMCLGDHFGIRLTFPWPSKKEVKNEDV